MKCLLVEPSPTVRRAVLRALRTIPDLEILEADGVEDLEQIEPPIALAVFGWSPQDNIGLDLLRALRANPGFADTRAVIVSPRGSHVDVRTALDAGAADYVLRPVSAETLAERLGRLVAAPEMETPKAA